MWSKLEKPGDRRQAAIPVEKRQARVLKLVLIAAAIRTAAVHVHQNKEEQCASPPTDILRGPRRSLPLGLG